MITYVVTILKKIELRHDRAGNFNNAIPPLSTVPMMRVGSGMLRSSSSYVAPSVRTTHSLQP